MTNYDKILKRFGKRPSVLVFSPTEYRVTVSDWHVHNGAMTCRPCGDGTTLENACANLLAFCDQPASMAVEGDHCDHVCSAKYMKSKTHQKAAHASLRSVIACAAANVESWPAWKRGLPPCVEQECEREADHEGRHRRQKPIEFEEW